MSDEPRVPGHERSYCGARLKQQREDGRTTCSQPRGYKTTHPGFGTCHLHGGATRSGVAAAEREKTEQLLTDARLTFGLPLDVEPADALLELVRTSAGIVAWLSRQVALLPADKVVEEGSKHPLLALYADERKQLAQAAKAAIDAGIAERRVQLEEDQGRLLVGLIERILSRFDELVFSVTGKRVLDPLDPKVRQIVKDELLQITAPEEAA